jgi:hypothetical protein
MKSDIKNYIISQLEQMVINDQKVIMDKSLSKKTRDNLLNLNYQTFLNIYNKYGLIKTSVFGEKAAHNAWLIVQHIPDDKIEFKEKYLKDMQDYRKEIIEKDIAFLKDKILVQRNQPQIFGTQLKKENSILSFFKIVDLKNIDKIRKDAGLESLKEYAIKTENLWGIKVILPAEYDN